jgi:hypothetical protein
MREIEKEILISFNNLNLYHPLKKKLKSIRKTFHLQKCFRHTA